MYTTGEGSTSGSTVWHSGTQAPHRFDLPCVCVNDAQVSRGAQADEHLGLDTDDSPGVLEERLLTPQWGPSQTPADEPVSHGFRPVCTQSS